ncbi:MAG: hypothetical protein WC858_06230 [Parcubacteria group bacterium]
MEKLVAIAIVVLMLLVAARYSWLICTDKNTSPVLATWILFLAASFLSFWTYWNTREHSLIGNMTNFSDLIAVTVILGSILIARGKESRLGFTKFQFFCLIASGIILILWKLGNFSPKTSNMLLQTIMTIAYFPTLGKLWSAKNNPEPIEVWSGVMIVSSLGLGLSISENNIPGIVYAGRSLFFSSIIVALIARIAWR